MPEPAAEGDRASRLSEARAGGPSAVEPTLPELLRGGWRRAGLAGRVAGIVAAVLLLGIVAWLLFARGGGSFSYDGSEAPPFSLSWSELERVEPSGDEILRLEGEDSATPVYLAITPLPDAAIPAAAEDNPIPALALYAAREERGPFEGDDVRLALEGWTELAVDRGPEAYQVAYADLRDGGAILVKRFLVPDPEAPGEGVRIEIGEVTTSSRVIEKVKEAPAGFFLNWPIQLLLEDAASVRTAEGLEEPLRSFSFG